ncbi:MAG: hypothetical protein V7609_2725 [Verrucomicrobiota bacterium]
MRLLLITALCLAGAVSAIGSEIREFSLPVIEKLGRELSRRDSIAARAADLVAESQPAAKSLKRHGWITELRPGGDIVYIIAETAAGPGLAYEVIFQGSNTPEVRDKRSQPLPPKIALRHKAVETARIALQGKYFDINYNFEVLDDPDGRGFLVYALAATNKKGEFPTGGHYRVTVSSDGSRVERVDLLSHFMKSRAKPGVKMEWITSSQVASNIPVETWIYSSNLYHVPIMIGTMDGSTWLINKGQIHKFTEAEIKELESGKGKKK